MSFPEFIGNLVIASTAVGLSCGAVIAASAGVRSLFDRFVEAEKAAVWNRIGRELVCDSHWYSEDAATQALIAEYGRQIRDNGAADVSQARQVWYQERNKEKFRGSIQGRKS